ncbi:ATP-binding protein [Fusibacter sp. JL216-2]|uniref:sensor histidine kinase n=1 Tax=Fusibacter sp. JL216-2 TaxID=3071453 RepID=UPI003D342766
MNRMVKMLLVALAISIGAQFSLNLFIEGFIITLSIIILPVLLYKNKDLNPIWIGCLTALVSPFIRGLIMTLQSGDLKFVFHLVYPDVVFYMTYGLVFYVAYWRRKEENITRFLITVFASDLISNLMEMAVRTRIKGMDGTIIRGLVFVAFARLLVVFGILVYLKWYKSFLVREEHEIRYRKLMMLTSLFKSEVYFMQKNMIFIERIMKKSYETYKLAESENVSKALKRDILDITKDVHEIKKDYVRVIQGLDQGFDQKLSPSKIEMKDLVNILEESTQEYIKNSALDVRLKSKVDSRVGVKKHYYLMSVLRNLVNNAIEACQGIENALVEIKIQDVPPFVHIHVGDNGMGMDTDTLSYIFNPGFSTKFDDATGDICRGIGLSMVKSLVRDNFRGSVDVQSEPGKGTLFTLAIPIQALEGETCDSI